MGTEAVGQAVTNTSKTPIRSIRVPSVFRCGVLILVLKAALKILGFEKTLRWMRTRVGRAELLGGVDSATVTATEHAVAVAGALYPGRALCLEQSLVLYYVLRRQGVAIKYCTGIQPHPFAAHAWAEYCGQVVNDVAEHVRHFTRLPDQLP